MYIISLTTKIPTSKTSKVKDTTHKPYFTVKGQTGNKTTMRTNDITKIVSLLFDSVVSNLNEAYFFSELSAYTGCKAFGYFDLIFSGLLKKTNSE